MPPDPSAFHGPLGPHVGLKNFTDLSSDVIVDGVVKVITAGDLHFVDVEGNEHTKTGLAAGTVIEAAGTDLMIHKVFATDTTVTSIEVGRPIRGAD